MVLHNRISADELKARLMAEPFRRVTLSFYRYTKIADPQAFRNTLYLALSQLEVLGRIYVAHEGINAQISVPEHHLEAFKAYMEATQGLERLRLNQAVDDDGKSFWVLKIKVKEKIVADGIEDPAFDMDRKGAYLDAARFNELVEDPRTVLVDMRNHYEYEVGHFERALEVPSDTFRDQLPMVVDMLEQDKDRPVIMYCTGGIRCEKASAYLLHHGFREVYHLEGGIIHYTRTAKERGLPNKFLGKNFVFDQRMGERISPDVISHCHQCGAPSDRHVNCSNEGCHLLFIQCESCEQALEGCCSEACRQERALPEDQRKELRRHKAAGPLFFNKSRMRLERDLTHYTLSRPDEQRKGVS